MKQFAFALLFAAVFSGFGYAKAKVVTSISDLAEFTKAIGGDRVEVDHLIRGPQNPHYIDVKPSYMLKLKSADLFIVVGMQLELWAPQIIDGSRNSNLIIVDCSKRIQKLEVPTGKVDASQGDIHPFGNPHYWLDPENVGPIMEEIFENLVKVSPGDQAYFKGNMESYLKVLEQRLVGWKTIMEPLKGSKIVTYHTSFSYFAKRFGLSVVGYVEPKPGIPPSPSHTAELIEMMRRGSVKVIGLEQYFEDNTPNRIAVSTGAKVVRLSTSVGGLEGTETYLDLIDHNVRQLAGALKGN